MKASTRNKIYTIVRTIRSVLKVTTIVCFVFLIAAAFPTPLKQFCKYAFFATGTLFLLLVVCRLCLSPFVKSDEEEEMEEKLEYLLQKRQAAERQTMIEGYSPLCNLTDEQTERIKRLLHDLPPHPEKPDHINLAPVSQHLTALQQLDKANLEDKRNLRLWVAKITDKNVPSGSSFNEALSSANTKKVAQARKKIEQLL